VPPKIDATALPIFDDTYVCDIEVSPDHGIPDSLRLNRDCVGIDASAFRSFVLQASASEGGDSWKGGRLVVCTSESAGDRYFYISNYGGFFERPDVQGTYVLPETVRDEWDALILRKSSR
jgi:hypothetical protein